MISNTRFTPLIAKIRRIVAVDAIQTSNSDPANIPSQPSNIDTYLMKEFISPEELTSILFRDSDNTTSDAVCFTLYWHHRLYHAPLIFFHWPSTCGILPKSIICVLKFPLCAVCLFATTHRKIWCTKSNSNNPIQ